MSYSSKGVNAGQTGHITRVRINCDSLFFSLIFHTFLHFLDQGRERMLNIDKSATSGLACPLDEASASWAQSSASPNGTHLEPLTRLNAVGILLDQHDDNVFAYLRFARSLHQNVPYFPGDGSLSLDQYLAIWALRDCSDVEIRTWLKEARKLCETAG